MEKEIVICGPIKARLWVSSDQPDTDITAKLVDVYPSSDENPRGFAMNLCDGILRLRYRDSWEHPKLMKPGKVYEIEVQLSPTANRFKKGHKIRLDISSSKFPHFDVNPNSGEPEGEGRAFRVAYNRIYMGEKTPSCILIPVDSSKS